MGTYPFGCPVLPCRPVASGHRDVFVLGAYPSALHVRWRPPPGPASRLVNALAVDNEPEPFWNGEDQSVRIESWIAGRDWREDWGVIEPVPRLNGPSGQWVQEMVLDPFGIDRSAASITDCLDTYRASVKMARAIETVYQPFAAERGLPQASLSQHPSENQIVTEAATHHLGRLRDELAAATPAVIVTLGNAALRVLRALVDVPVGPPKLSALPGYGESLDVTVGGSPIRWFPLAHPAAPAVYQAAHRRWIVGRGQHVELGRHRARVATAASRVMNAHDDALDRLGR